MVLRRGYRASRLGHLLCHPWDERPAKYPLPEQANFGRASCIYAVRGRAAVNVRSPPAGHSDSGMAAIAAVARRGSRWLGFLDHPVCRRSGRARQTWPLGTRLFVRRALHLAPRRHEGTKPGGAALTPGTRVPAAPRPGRRRVPAGWVRSRGPPRRSCRRPGRGGRPTGRRARRRGRGPGRRPRPARPGGPRGCPARRRGRR
jgi:hypothetical protein